MNWKFQPSGIPYLDDTVTSTNPVLLHTSGTPVPIQQICPYHNAKEFKSLGVRTPATLSDHYEYKNIIKRAVLFPNFYPPVLLLVMKRG